MSRNSDFQIYRSVERLIRRRMRHSNPKEAHALGPYNLITIIQVGISFGATISIRRGRLNEISPSSSGESTCRFCGKRVGSTKAVRRARDMEAGLIPSESGIPRTSFLPRSFTKRPKSSYTVEGQLWPRARNRRAEPETRARLAFWLSLRFPIRCRVSVHATAAPAFARLVLAEEKS